METNDILNEMMDAIMYAEMDEEEFWETSTISPEKARDVAKAWELIYNTRLESELKQKEFSKRFADQKGDEQC